MKEQAARRTGVPMSLLTPHQFPPLSLFHCPSRYRQVDALRRFGRCIAGSRCEAEEGEDARFVRYEEVELLRELRGGRWWW